MDPIIPKPKPPKPYTVEQFKKSADTLLQGVYGTGKSSNAFLVDLIQKELDKGIDEGVITMEEGIKFLKERKNYYDTELGKQEGEKKRMPPAYGEEEVEERVNFLDGGDTEYNALVTKKYIELGGKEGTGMDIDKFAEEYFPKMADGGRIGFYKGSSAVKSHGAEIKKLTEAGESSVTIAKKLGLAQQTVNAAMDAMDKGIAGEEFQLSKPRSEIIKQAVNQTGVNLKDPKHVDEVIQWIDNNPKANQKDAIKIFGKRKAQLVDSKFYGSPGKKWSDEKAKLRNETEKAWTKKYSNISIEDKTRGDMSIHRHHAGGLREKVGTYNTMFLDAQDNYKNIRKFEDAINDIQLKQYQTNLNRSMPIDEKKKIFVDLKKQEDALRKKYPQFADYKSTLVFEESPLSKTGFKYKEVMPNPSLTLSEGKTGQNFKYRGTKPSSEEGKKIIELSKNKLKTFGKYVKPIGKVALRAVSPFVPVLGTAGMVMGGADVAKAADQGMRNEELGIAYLAGPEVAQNYKDLKSRVKGKADETETYVP